ncbi:NAD(P)-binding domain-containing protein [Pendulispora brunnea]|uniref:NAD(P)-binding domain-containing protein n=1 Tax=Pendulispora brunnea TaxID=2905690 RepID=A0ABZ2JW63_9BACT
MSTSSNAAVTILGLGLMGSALAGAYLAKGHATTIWNRTAGKGDGLVAKGARRAATAAEAVEASKIAIICVLDYETTRAIIEPLAEALAGKLLVNLTSGQPEQARAMAKWAGERGIDYLDGAIMSTPPGIGQAETLLLYGGSRALFDAHRTTLAVMGGGSVHVAEDPGSALLYDIGLLGIMYSTLAGYFTSLALVGADGVSAKTFTPYVEKWLGALATFLTSMGQQVDARDYHGAEATLAMQAVGLNHFIEAHERRGIEPVPIKYVRALVDRAVAEGHGADDLPRLVEYIKKR